MIDEILKNRIETALSTNSLLILFEEFEAEHLGPKELENVFSDFLKSIPQDTKREEDEERVIELLERITGYCHPDRRLFPPEQYQDYPGFIRFFAAHNDQKVILRFIIENTSFRVFRSSSYENENLEIKSFDEVDFSETLRFYLWNKVISNEYSIHKQWFEHIQKNCWSFISDPTFFLHFGESEKMLIEPSIVSYAFCHSPTQAAFDSIEPIRLYINDLKVATAIGIPVLQNACSLTEQGFHLKESAETRWEYNLDLK